jgi:hypothetical protein
LSRAALFAAGVVGAAVATTDCGSSIAAYGGSPPNPIEDSSASDGASEAAPDATDASATTDSASTSDGSASAADAPILLQQAYGAAVLPDE